MAPDELNIQFPVSAWLCIYI